MKLSVTKLVVSGAISAAVALATPGCSGAANQQALTDVGQVAACAIGALVAGGIADPMLIVQQCAGLTLADLEQIAASLINSLTASADAGALSPQEQVRLTNLRTLHDKTVVLLAAKKSAK